jgi:hypothetical protein
MKKLLIGIATASLLISAGATFAQGQTPMVQKDAPAKPAQAAPAQTQSAPLTSQASPRTGTAPQSGERREGRRGDGGERRGDRSERREGGERSGINIRTGGDRNGYRDGYRHRRSFGYAEYGSRCRTTIVKSYRHGRRVIKRIRRCW